MRFDARCAEQVGCWGAPFYDGAMPVFSRSCSLHRLYFGIKLRSVVLVFIAAGGSTLMPTGTLDLMKIDGQPATYQIMFEQNAGGTFVARVDQDELVPFLHEEMRVDLTVAETAAQQLTKESRIRMPNVFLEENNLHAVMDYMEEDIS
jgi:hypothetical protein